MQTASVAFRVDANQQVGLGHFRRCLTLADWLDDLGCTIRLVCRNRLGPAVASLAARYTVCALEEGPGAPTGGLVPDEELWDAKATLSVMGKGEHDTSWVVVDSYQLGHRWERRVRDAGHRIMVIDDFRDRMHHADLLVSDSETPFDPKLNECAGVAQTLVGREYSLIGPEYEYFPAPFPRKTGLVRLLVSYGGADSANETLKAIRAVGMLKSSAATRDVLGQVDVVVGQLNPFANDIARLAQYIQDVVVHRAPRSLAAMIRATDLFLTAGGNSLVEALALRKPTLVTVTSDNQVLMVNQLVEEGMIRLLGARATVTPEVVAAAIVSVLADLDRFARRVASRPLFDHLGAQRIATAMLKALGQDAL